MLTQILVGLVIAGIGGIIIYFSAQLTDLMGRISRADQHLGGTRNGYILAGFGIIIIGFLILFGVIALQSPTASIDNQGLTAPPQ